MFEPDQNGIYAVVEASPGRRLFAYGVQFLLGGLVIYVSLVQPPALGWLIFMLAFGALMIVQAERLRRATLMTISLTEDAIVDSEGTVLARIADVTAVERGALAFKPSNGFTLVTKTKQPRRWVPGMWWCIGRRVGIGGVTGAGQTKFMAEQIALRIKGRAAS